MSEEARPLLTMDQRHARVVAAAMIGCRHELSRSRKLGLANMTSLKLFGWSWKGGKR